jgi:hypothetical protein
VSRSFANFISIVFHPFLLATYLFSIIVLLDPMLALPPGYNKLAQWLIVLIIWLTTFAIPALSMAMLKYTGSISSLQLKDRKERIIPFIYITLFYAFTAYYFSQQMLVTDLTSGIFILTTVMIAAAAIITLFWKISVHSLGLGGSVGILLTIAYLTPETKIKYVLFAAVVVSGLVMSARLKLDAHTPSQVYLGYLLGLFVSFMIIFWF